MAFFGEPAIGLIRLLCVKSLVFKSSFQKIFLVKSKRNDIFFVFVEGVFLFSRWMEKNNNNNKKKNDDEKDEEEDRSGFRSSREALRRSQSSPALREQRGALLSSGQRLWGKDFDENDGDTTLQRILRENKARRAPRTQYVGLEVHPEKQTEEEGKKKRYVLSIFGCLESFFFFFFFFFLFKKSISLSKGREWRIEGWTGQGAQQPMHVYHDVALLAQGVTVQKCNFAVVTIATKISHLMINNVNNSKIRLNKGCVTSVELVHCENVELTIASGEKFLAVRCFFFFHKHLVSQSQWSKLTCVATLQFCLLTTTQDPSWCTRRTKTSFAVKS